MEEPPQLARAWGTRPWRGRPVARAGVTQLSTPGTQPLCEKHLTEPTGPEAPGQWALGESGDRLGLGLMWEASHTVSPCSWPCPQVPRRCTPAGTQTGAPGRSQRGSVARPGNTVGPGSVRSCYPQPPPQEPGWMSPGWTPGQALQLGPGTLALQVVGGICLFSGGVPPCQPRTLL